MAIRFHRAVFVYVFVFIFISLTSSCSYYAPLHVFLKFSKFHASHFNFNFNVCRSRDDPRFPLPSDKNEITYDDNDNDDNENENDDNGDDYEYEGYQYEGQEYLHGERTNQSSSREYNRTLSPNSNDFNISNHSNSGNNYDNHSYNHNNQSSNDNNNHYNNRSNNSNNNRYQDNSDSMYVYTDARSNRMIQNEAAIREEMFRECTFQPKIKELPSAYGVGKDSRGELQSLKI